MSKKAASIAGLTEERVADLKEAFAMFDINGDGEFGTFSIFHACLPACFERKPACCAAMADIYKVIQGFSWGAK